MWHTLSYSTKDAVKTSVLSKRWKNIWQQVPGLDLNSEEFENLSGFFSLANSFFDLQRGSLIRKLSLHISGWGHDGYTSFPNPWIDDSPTMRNIQHLDIRTTALSSITVLPLSIYTCKTLVHLRLRWVTLVKTEFVSLPCLKILHLEQVMYPNKATLEKLISGSLLLEDLTLISLSSPKDDQKVLHVRSQTLKRIAIYLSAYVEIDAPLLHCLRANVNVHKKFIINSGFPVKTDISFCGKCDHDLIHDIFTDISRVRDLVISSNTWKVPMRAWLTQVS